MRKKGMAYLDSLSDRKFNVITAYIDFMIDKGARKIDINTEGGTFEIITDISLSLEVIQSPKYQRLVRNLNSAFGN